jgi:hypothetical protein
MIATRRRCEGVPHWDTLDVGRPTAPDNAATGTVERLLGPQAATRGEVRDADFAWRKARRVSPVAIRSGPLCTRTVLNVQIIHTSDWHLGRTHLGVNLLEHQAAYLDHLVELVERVRPAAVLVSGDVYDRGIPPVEAVNHRGTTTPLRGSASVRR